MALVATVFGILVVLLQDSSRVVNLSNQKDAARSAGQVGLERVCNELWEATAVDSPATAGSPSTTLTFEKVDPSATTRLPTPIPTPAGTFDFADPSFHLTVTYELDGQRFMRAVGPRGGSPTIRMQVAENIVGFNCTPFGRGQYDLRLTIQVGNNLYSYYSSVSCPGLE
jgi:hypothetical protein